ncbi:MAG: RES domain-containing protein [Saprospirales bacterium]|nr:MAG: RES domain-containing protein [Saprospirales bacterium]
MIVYRLTKQRYSGDLSGKGAALFPGRWNKKGTPVLYTSESIELAILEYLVNLPSMISPALDLLKLEIPDNSVYPLKPNLLPPNWNQYPAPDVLADYTQEWIENGRTLALKVPSSIVKSSCNYILNCRHERYDEVRILEKEEFFLDTRLAKW